MKKIPFTTIVYERSSDMSDMFVPRRVTVSTPVEKRGYRSPIVAIALLAVIAVPTLLSIGGTNSYFRDNEQSTGNTFAAGPLDFTVTSGRDSATLFLAQPGETFVLTPTSVAGSLPMQYRVSGTASGNAAFCAAISAIGSDPFTYSGSVVSFTTIDTNSFAPWSLALSLQSPAPGVVDGQKCVLDLKYEAYQEGGTAGAGYHDTEHIVLTLTADLPVIAPITQTDPLPQLTQSLEDSLTIEEISTNPAPPIEDSEKEETSSSELTETPSLENDPPSEDGAITVPPVSQTDETTPSDPPLADSTTESSNDLPPQ